MCKLVKERGKGRHKECKESCVINLLINKKK